MFIENKAYQAPVARKVARKGAIILAILMAMPGFASSAAPFNRYQQTHIEVTNQTKYVALMRIDDYEGVWKKPVIHHQLFELAPGQMYQNTLLSLTKDHAIKNFVSVMIARKDSPRKNYLIFAESTNSKRQEVVGDIFDGLGDMFVSSWLNACKDRMADGYAVCKLVIFDKS